MSDESTATEQPADDQSIGAMLEEAYDEQVSDERPAEAEQEDGGTDGEDVAEVSGEVSESPEDPHAEEAAVEAPENWPDEDREMFAKQPQEVQKYLLNRHKAMEGDYTRKAQEIAEYRKEYEPVHEMFKPHLQQLRQQGLTPSALIAEWAQIAQQLQNNPAQTLQMLAKYHNVDLSQTDAQTEFQDPAVSELQQQLNSLQQSLTQREQSDFQARIDARNLEIQQFSEEKTEAGELAHPYFGDVMDEMAALAKTAQAEGRSPNLKDLYDKAVWMNTSVRNKILSSQREAEDKKRQEEARQKAAKAKQASRSVTGSPGGETPVTDLSIREQLEQAYNA